MKKSRRAGFTMIELIVVMAIIGVLTAMASIGFSYLKAGNVKNAAHTINANLTKLRYDALSAKHNERPYMYIYKKGDRYYFLCTTDDNPTLTEAKGTLVCNGRCKITYNNGTEITAKGLKIAYKKGSGSFMTISSGIPCLFSGASQEKADITVEREEGNGIKYSIVVIKETGKHYIEKK